MQTDSETAKWVESFFKGSLLVKGWDGRSRELLALIKERTDEVKSLLGDLGDRMAGEWAKDNSIRKIDNNDLMKWGELMKTAAKKSEDALVEAIREISDEVDKRIS